MDEQQRRLAEELLFSGKSYPGFVKLLFFGLFDSDSVLPYPKASDDEVYLAKVKQFAEKEIDARVIDREACIPDHVIRGLGELGVLGMTIPQNEGGLGMPQDAYCRAVEEIARHCSSTALFINAHQSIGLKALLLFGTEEQKRRWLPPLARGEILAAFSLTEPNAGSDASGIETKAIYDAEKKIYRLTGKKQWTTNGGVAQILTVMAKTDEKVTAFLVTPDMPGFKVTAAALEKVGMRGTKTANLEFLEMPVPEENILGPLGGGLKVCLTVLDYGRTTFGATCTGTAKVLLESAISHARSRYQFKRPLASFGLVKKKIAKISALTYAMEATTYLTAGLVDRKVEDFMLEAAILKVFASEALWDIVFETMQIYGGRSFFTDRPFERMMRDARLNTIGEGSNEVLRAFIGLVGMRDVGMHLKAGLEAVQNPFEQGNQLWNFLKSSFKRIKKPVISLSSKALGKEASDLESAIQRFGFAVVQVLGKYRENIVEQQLVLERIANAAMALYTMTAVISKADSDPQGMSIAKLYCQMAMKNFRDNISTLFSNFDRSIEAVSDQLTDLGNW